MDDTPEGIDIVTEKKKVAFYRATFEFNWEVD